MSYKIEDNEHRVCIECGREFDFGRSDKVFCSNQCRNTHHNRVNRDTRNIRNKTLTGLNTNYTVLEKLMKLEITSISLVDICQMGFNPELMTGHIKRKPHDECRCFDIKYCRTGTKIFKIEKTTKGSL